MWQRLCSNWMSLEIKYIQKKNSLKNIAINTLLKIRHIPPCLHLTKSNVETHSCASQPHSQFPGGCVCACVSMLTSKRSLLAHPASSVIEWSARLEYWLIFFPCHDDISLSPWVGSPVCPWTPLPSMLGGWFPPWNEFFPRHLGHWGYPVIYRSLGIFF